MTVLGSDIESTSGSTVSTIQLSSQAESSLRLVSELSSHRKQLAPKEVSPVELVLALAEAATDSSRLLQVTLHFNSASFATVQFFGLITTLPNRASCKYKNDADGQRKLSC